MRAIAVILAAGAGTRMGGPKALLPMPGDGREETFIARAVRVASAVAAEVIVVVGHGAAEVRAAVGTPARVHIVTNPAPERGQLSSLQVGAAAAERLAADGILVWPVDNPAIDESLVGRVLDAAAEAPGCIVIPSRGGHGGHPSYVPADALAALVAYDGPDGARGFFHAHEAAVRRIETSDPGAFVDIDTPEDLRKL